MFDELIDEEILERIATNNNDCCSDAAVFSPSDVGGKKTDLRVSFYSFWACIVLAGVHQIELAPSQTASVYVLVFIFLHEHSSHKKITRQTVVKSPRWRLNIQVLSETLYKI